MHLTEAEIGQATLDLAGQGIYVEPTAAQAAAALAKLLASGVIAPDQTTVLVLTGSGLKATPRIAELLTPPVMVGPAPTISGQLDGDGRVKPDHDVK